MEESYCEFMKSGVADMANIGGGNLGGSIFAALFLKQVHLCNLLHTRFILY